MKYSTTDMCAIESAYKVLRKYNCLVQTMLRLIGCLSWKK